MCHLIRLYKCYLFLFHVTEPPEGPYLQNRYYLVALQKQLKVCGYTYSELEPTCVFGELLNRILFPASSSVEYPDC